jgi:hypothetical protein
MKRFLDESRNEIKRLTRYVDGQWFYYSPKIGCLFLILIIER